MNELHKNIKLFLLSILLILTQFVTVVYTSESIPQPKISFNVFTHEQELLLGVQAKIPPGWTVYAPAPKGFQQQGFAPEIHIDNGQCQPFWPAARMMETELGMALGYQTKVMIPCKITLDRQSSMVTGHLKALMCNGLCVPIMQQFSITVENNPNALKWLKLMEHSNISAPMVWGSTLTFMLLGFCGGLILNLMPCVLPVLALKTISITKSGLHRKKLYANFLGIISSFMLFATMLCVLRYMGHEIGWGLHFQSNWFVGLMTIVVVFFANNMLGVFNFDPFNMLSNNLYAKLQKRRGFITEFFMGILATLLATPCTAPFLGTAVGFAVSQNVVTIFCIFGAIGTGFGLPYLLLAILPPRLHWLPRPGMWMNKMKHLCAIALFLTAMWLLWVFLALTNVVCAFLLLLSSLLFTMYCLKFSRASLMIGVVILFTSCVVTSSLVTVTDAVWHPFDQCLIQQKLDSGIPVFVDITAKWCVTCQANKLRVLNNGDVKKLFVLKDVYLMRADWTSYSPHISQFIKSHKRAGIPCNILYSKARPKGQVLPEILSKKLLIQLIENLE